MKNRMMLLLFVGALAHVGTANAAAENVTGLVHFAGMRAQGMMGQGMMGQSGGGSTMMSGPSSHAHDVEGRDIFEGQCAQCHSLKPNASGIGPNLSGIVGRKAATAVGYNYSAAIKSSGVIWSEAALDAFIKAPQSYIPGNNMPYAGLADGQARQRLIAFLKRNTGR